MMDARENMEGLFEISGAEGQGGEVAGESAFFTPEQLAAYVQVPLRTVQKWAMAKRIPGMVRAGRLLRFRRADIERAALNGSILLPKLEKPRKTRSRWG